MGKRLKRPRFLRSTSVRLSLRFAALYSLVTALVFVMAYTMAKYEVTKWVEEQLINDEYAVELAYKDQGLGIVIDQIFKFETFNFEDHRLSLLTGPGGARIAGSVENVIWDRTGNHVDVSAIAFFKPPHKDVSGYILREIKLGENTLILGTSTFFLTELLEALGNAFLVGFMFVLIGGTGAGIIVGRRTERRLAMVSNALRAVSGGDLEARIPVDGRDTDDLARVSAETNKTLVVLQNLVEGQKQISADIAHDLKTPMQRLRQRLEKIGESPDLTPDLISDVFAAIDATDDLIDTFHALLRISQIEIGDRRERFARVDLAPILTRIEDAYGAVAEEKEQSLSFVVGAGPFFVTGDQQLLTQMMANLVENALRHCPAGAIITVSLEIVADSIVFIVSDNGAGIAKTEQEKVFRRFYRVDKSRTTSGNGLGLSLVKAVADLHDASIELRDNTPGLRVIMTFEADPV